MNKVFIAGLALSAVLLAGPAGAHSIATGVPHVAQPAVTGEIVSWTDHSIVLRTDENETMTFLIDSRTVVPNSFSPGERVGIEFHTMDNGDLHAQRITPIANAPGLYGGPASMNVNTETHPDNMAAYASTNAHPVAYNEETEMPRTASPLPLVGLLGFASLAGAWVVRRFRRA